MVIKYGSTELNLYKQGTAFRGSLPLETRVSGTVVKTNCPISLEAQASKPSGGFRRLMFKITVSVPKITAYTGGSASGGIVGSTNLNAAVDYSVHMVTKVPAIVADLWLRLGGIVPADGLGGIDPNLAFAFMAVQHSISALLAVALGTAFTQSSYDEVNYPVWAATPMGKGLTGFEPVTESDSFDLSA